MSRVRKWRVWDSRRSHGRMLYFDPTETPTIDSLYYKQIALSVLDSGEDWIVMDFTGLQDADGRDIYEGDILQAADPETSSIVAVVEWDGSSAMFVALYDEICDSLSDLHSQGVRIVGNVHENKKLLEAT